MIYNSNVFTFDCNYSFNQDKLCGEECEIILSFQAEEFNITLVIIILLLTLCEWEITRTDEGWRWETRVEKWKLKRKFPRWEGGGEGGAWEDGGVSWIIPYMAL